MLFMVKVTHEYSTCQAHHPTKADLYKNTLANTTQNYYFTLGYNIQLDEGINFQPSILSRVAAGAPINTLLSAFFSFFYDQFALFIQKHLYRTMQSHI